MLRQADDSVCRCDGGPAALDGEAVAERQVVRGTQAAAQCPRHRLIDTGELTGQLCRAADEIAGRHDCGQDAEPVGLGCVDAVASPSTSSSSHN